MDQHDHQQPLDGDEPGAVERCFGADFSNGLIGLDDPAPTPPGPPCLLFVPEQDRARDREAEDESDTECSRERSQRAGLRYSPISSMR